MARYNSTEVNLNSQSKSKKKAAKGTVVVQVFRERLRLCWSFSGKRYFLYIGLPNSKVNKIVAEQKAKQIAGDMATGNFDPTLKKYKSDHQLQHNQKSVVDIFKLFMEERAKGLYSRSLEKYEATLNYLATYFKDQSARSIDVCSAEQFAQWLQIQTSPLNDSTKTDFTKGLLGLGNRKTLNRLSQSLG